MLKLMNSAMMPCEGIYTCEKISCEKYREIFTNHKKFKSSIGYASTAEIIEKITGVKIPLNRDLTTISEGDIILVSKLKYRVDPEEKKAQKHGTKIDDFEFFVVTYEKLK